jgi:hypothetical protein
MASAPPPISQAHQPGSAPNAQTSSQPPNHVARSGGDLLSGLLGMAALVVAVMGWLTADRQADIAEQQNNITSATLNFSIAEAKSADEDTRVSLSIATDAAKAARDQATALKESLEISRKQNGISANALNASASATLLQTRVGALTRYNSAYGRLDAEFQDVAAALAEQGFDLETSEALSDLTMQNARRIAKIARPSIAVFRSYASEVNNSRGVWKSKTDKEIKHAYEDGLEAMRCFNEAGLPPASETLLPAHKRLLETFCKNLFGKWKNFRDASNVAANSMSFQVLQTTREATGSRSSGIGYADPHDIDSSDHNS